MLPKAFGLTFAVPIKKRAFSKEKEIIYTKNEKEKNKIVEEFNQKLLLKEEEMVDEGIFDNDNAFKHYLNVIIHIISTINLFMMNIEFFHI